MKEVKLKPKKERDQTFSIRVEKDLLDSYEELSGITGYSRNQLINNAMKHYLDSVCIDTNDEKMIEKVAEFRERYNYKNL